MNKDVDLSGEKFRRLQEIRRADVRDYYHMSEHAHEYGKPLVWSCACGISELINSMDIVTFRPASYCAVAAAKGLASSFSNVSSEAGYSNDLCSYGRVSFGMVISGKAPYGAMNVPDALVNDATLCDCDCKGWEVFAWKYNVPMYNFEGPLRFGDTVPSHFLTWKTDELKGCVKFLEDHTGRTFNYERFRETMVIAGKTRRLYSELQELRKLRPSPVDHQELYDSVFYQANAPGRQTAVDYLELFLEVARENARKGIGAVENEIHRIFFDGIPVWHDLRLYKYLKELGVAIVWDTYTNMEFMPHYFWGVGEDPDKPFEALATKYLYSINNLSTRLNMQAVKRAVREWGCEGAVFYDNKSCKPYSSNNRLKSKMLREAGIPTLILEMDHSDPSGYSPQEVRTQLKNFVEYLETGRAKK